MGEEAKSNEVILVADQQQGNPLSTVYKQVPSTKPLYPTPGIPRQLFIDIVRTSCLIHALSSSSGNKELDYLDPTLIKKYLPKTITIDTIKKVIESPNFTQALILRGVINPSQANLTGEQMRALAVLTDITSHASLETKLKRAGIPSWKWNAWTGCT